MFYYIFISLLFVLMLVSNKRRASHKIPGPFLNLPIVGYLPFLRREQIQITFMNWSKLYGKIIGIQLGSFRTIILNDYQMIRQAFDESAFSGRPDMPAVNEFLYAEKRGLTSSDGLNWKEQRQFTINTLRDFGFGKKSMESLIEDEAKEMVDALAADANLGKAVPLQQRFSLVILNTFWRIISGQRFEHDDLNLKRFLKQLTDGIQSTSHYAMFIPWYWKLTCKLARLSGNDAQGKEEILNFYSEQITGHKESIQESECRDFIDVYLKEINQANNKDSSFYKTNGEKNLVAVVHDLFFGGSETTSVTLTWAVLYVVYHSEVQNKLSAEIDQVVGRNRLPTLADRPKMPYTISVIMETLRKSTIFPLGTFHSALEDIEFQGYKIPKGSLIIPNIWAAHHDPLVWDDPDVFKPERFLTKDGRVRRPEALLPFGSGERVCIGGALAREELFLFLTSIFQRFTLEFNPAEPTPRLQANSNFFLTPRPFSVIIKDRFDNEKN